MTLLSLLYLDRYLDFPQMSDWCFVFDLVDVFISVVSFCAPVHTEPHQPTLTHEKVTPTHTNSHRPIKRSQPPSPTHTDP